MSILYLLADYRNNDADNEDIEFPPGNIGRIWFSWEYQPSDERLTVDSIKIRNLQNRPGGGVRNPLVKVCALPFERQTNQTVVKKKSNNPRYDESFHFQISQTEFQRSRLRLSIFDNEGRRQYPIGHITCPLLDLDTSSKKTVWKDIEKGLETSYQLGAITFALQFIPPDRVTVTILSAKDLPAHEKLSHQCFLVKATLRYNQKPIKTKKTNIVKKTVDPTFDESFQFKVSKEHIESTANIVIEVLCRSSHSFKADRNVGQVIIGGKDVVRGQALDHWQEIISSPQQSAQKTYSLSPP
ncbi:Synaptotagmin-15 [Trichoplax sp. H2]|nr:Synaptotagmin-15 [Trichoplax sp. H2]|eukprot:RDD38991.1 Synaptotagmin-15 [Trichoplax sp. H2]